MAVQIQMRRDTAAAWLLVDPILAEGEWGQEKDTGNWKNGDGINIWSVLPYVLGPFVFSVFPEVLVHPPAPGTGAIGYVLEGEVYLLLPSGGPKIIGV